MSHLLSVYFTFNVLLVAAFVAVKWFGRGLGPASQLRLNYYSMTAVFIIAGLSPWLPKAQVFQPAVKVWSAPSYKTFSDPYVEGEQKGYLSVPAWQGRAMIETEKTKNLALGVSLLFLILSLGGLTISVRRLLSIRRSAYTLKRFGCVRILVHDRIDVPFSYWWPGEKGIIVGRDLLLSAQDFKAVVAHEIQHHRQGDTKWIYILSWLRWICPWNPVVYLWTHFIFELQEFACDATLIDQGKVDSHSYARCLIEVAETALHRGRIPACATGLTFLSEGHLLKRRIEKMLTVTKPGRTLKWWSSLAVVASLTMTAAVARGVVKDRRVSMAEAQRMAARAQKGTEFPIVLNDLVLAQLNRFIGTPEGREYIRDSLQRMESHRAMIEEKLKEYDVPNEIMAVPIVESAYQNLPESNRQGYGAGLWMFITSTARFYGLRVDDQVDERLNTKLLTDAAMRYLKSERLRFNDWHLALMSYNIGDERLRDRMAKYGTRDAWTLVRRGVENDRNYLPKVMAAIIILKNPESVMN